MLKIILSTYRVRTEKVGFKNVRRTIMFNSSEACSEGQGYIQKKVAFREAYLLEMKLILNSPPLLNSDVTTTKVFL